MTESVTVLGLGPMGSALAHAFVAAGHPTTVWNRTPDKADALVAAGATKVATVADAVAASKIVVVCVIDYAAVRAILDPAAAKLRGRLVVNVTSGAPDSARELAEWAAGPGIDYLDGAIMTPTHTIGTPDAVVLHSGPEHVYRAAAATLDTIGGTAHYLGADPPAPAAPTSPPSTPRRCASCGTRSACGRSARTARSCRRWSPCGPTGASTSAAWTRCTTGS